MAAEVICIDLLDYIYSRDEMERHGFLYVGIGRKSAHAARL
jgi:hypothetical protein